MSSSTLKIGVIGLDTSHVTAFSELLHEEKHEHHVPGGEVVAAYPGGSPDFALSYSRVGQFQDELETKYGVQMVNDIADIPSLCDAILLESVDGRVHLEQFQRIVQARKPIFIDKPFALNSEEAMAIVRLAKEHQTPLMSCSALRYSDALTATLTSSKDAVIGCDTFGPMAIEPTQSGLFWYGIHCVEMLFAVLGKDCVSVRVASNDDYDEVVGVWADGRIGTIRGNRKGNYKFAAVIHRERDIQFVDVSACSKPYYASLLERIIEFFHTGVPPIDVEETLAIVRFIERANESRVSGETLQL